MKFPFWLSVLCASVLPCALPVLAAPAATPGPKTGAPKTTDPLDIPAFAAIPNEFVFAGTHKDLQQLFGKITAQLPLDPATKPAPNVNPARLQLVRDAAHLVSSIHAIRVRSLSYRAQGDKGYQKNLDTPAAKAEPVPLAPDDAAAEADDPYDREQRRLKEAEAFYAALFARQGGTIPLQLKGETSITVYAFAAPKTYAVVTRGPSRVIVARADGTPDIGTITRIFTAIVGG